MKYLGANEEDGSARAVVGDLADPLGGDVVEAGRVHHREAQQEHIRLRVAERSAAIERKSISSLPHSDVDFKEKKKKVWKNRGGEMERTAVCHNPL